MFELNNLGSLCVDFRVPFDYDSLHDEFDLSFWTGKVKLVELVAFHEFNFSFAWEPCMLRIHKISPLDFTSHTSFVMFSSLVT